MNTLQFLVNWFQCGSAMTGWDSSYHMCRNHFVQQTPPCSQAGKHMYCTTVIILKGQAQSFTFHLLNLCSDHKINLQKDTYCLTGRDLPWKGIQSSPSHVSKRSFFPLFIFLTQWWLQKFYILLCTVRSSSRKGGVFRWLLIIHISSEASIFAALGV